MLETEQALLDAAQKGDQGAFSRLYDLNVNAVHRFARGMGVPQAEIEDAVQEVFVIAFRRIGGFDGKARLSTWLYAIALRVCKAHARKAYWRSALHDLFGREPQEGGPERPDAAVERTLSREMVFAALDRMKEKKRTVLVMREMMDMSEDETAAALGISRGTAATRLFHARRDFETIAGRLMKSRAKQGGND
ncbi:MAG: sigma-70 family RNA polymerase sigma factor [Deltaproteobacteria bacterium]|nr:sigma-70 family RNA polymerase sigma factor [Deltaproteobacteria bacterium]